ncbi:MAG: hypothetical protein B6240_01930 [Desulfobacteraceae bacterium 4572_87]|nr:MAG: hypothetical protein B6240_01930 [Desulfobacteraceae bacterium 4572_87]
MKRGLKRDVASYQLRYCFSGEALWRYFKGNLSSEERSRIYHHLNVEKCRRCRTLFMSLQQPESDERPVPLNTRMIERLKGKMEKPAKPPVPLRLDRFQVWTTSPTPRNRMGEPLATIPLAVPVLIISPGNKKKTFENRIRVFPLSRDTDFYFEPETLKIESGGPLHYPFLVEIFNETPMQAGNLGEYRGDVQREQRDKIEAVRRRFSEKTDIKPDKEYLKWKQREMDMTRYLALPVNMDIWPDEAETVEFDVRPYRLAADAGGLELDEITPRMVMEGEDFSLFILQKRDQILLRFVSDTLTPDISVDGQSRRMAPTLSGLFEGVLGNADQIPASMVIARGTGENRMERIVTFRRSH